MTSLNIPRKLIAIKPQRSYRKFVPFMFESMSINERKLSHKKSNAARSFSVATQKKKEVFLLWVVRVYRKLFSLSCLMEGKKRTFSSQHFCYPSASISLGSYSFFLLLLHRPNSTRRRYYFHLMVFTTCVQSESKEKRPKESERKLNSIGIINKCLMTIDIIPCVS